MRHGTRGGYVMGCRCDDCHAAQLAYMAERRRLACERRSERVEFAPMPQDRYVADVPPDMHGRHSTYTNHFCRCGPCTDAARRYMARWRTRRAA